MPETATTQDGFLDGRLSVFQPKKGFRAGIDSVLLAAAVHPGAVSILEMGAGAGVAACCLLADLARATLTLAERDPHMISLAKRNIQHNGFCDRAIPVQLDVTARGSVRKAAGIKRDFYDSVIANPPFFQTGSSVPAPLPMRAGARQMPAADLEKWIRTAAASARPGGEAIFVHTARALPGLLAGFEGRFGNLAILPIVSRPGEPANRILIRGIKGSKAPPSLLSPLVLHPRTGNRFLPGAKAIFNGRSRLNW